ncbi:hypothetical protein KEM52_005497 [Ascosphaera acerosa]|nr:hypothetical protein KEM52_005497 [Ascosphaera acerosa]
MAQLSEGAEPAAPTSVSGPRRVLLKNRRTTATILPFKTGELIPRSLLGHLCKQLNDEVAAGETLPMTEPVAFKAFQSSWFSKFGAIMLLGDIARSEALLDMEAAGVNWSDCCIGCFAIHPHFPGRSSHICSGTFLVARQFRGRGAGRAMGETYLDWASGLGYTYALFPLVYETNVPACRLWDSLGFKRIGKIPGSGSVRTQPSEFVDGIIFGRSLNTDLEDLALEERFDKIRYYLKHSKYPSGSDRAEKSRLRSAATHYRLEPGQEGEPDKLLLKDKEVISDPQRQLEIAREVHVQQHAGINKTTATIALKYHWVRIKETVNTIIRSCPECKESASATSPSVSRRGSARARARAASSNPTQRPPSVPASGRQAAQQAVDAPPQILMTDSTGVVGTLEVPGSPAPALANNSGLLTLHTSGSAHGPQHQLSPLMARSASHAAKYQPTHNLPITPGSSPGDRRFYVSRPSGGTSVSGSGSDSGASPLGPHTAADNRLGALLPHQSHSPSHPPSPYSYELSPYSPSGQLSVHMQSPSPTSDVSMDVAMERDLMRAMSPMQPLDDPAGAGPQPHLLNMPVSPYDFQGGYVPSDPSDSSNRYMFQ